MKTTLTGKKEKRYFKLIKLTISTGMILGILLLIAGYWYNASRQKELNRQAENGARNFYLACLSDVDFTGDKFFDGNHLPPDYYGMPPFRGSFVYVVSGIAIRCDAKFKHPNGTKTYALDSNGRISASP